MSKSVQIVTPNVILDKELQKVFRDSGIRVIQTTNSLKTTIGSFKLERPYVLVVDLFLGEHSGLDLIKTTRQLDSDINTILLTSVYNRSLKDKAMRLGAKDILVMPMAFTLIRDLVLHRASKIKISEGN